MKQNFKSADLFTDRNVTSSEILTELSQDSSMTLQQMVVKSPESSTASLESSSKRACNNLVKVSVGTTHQTDRKSAEFIRNLKLISQIPQGTPIKISVTLGSGSQGANSAIGDSHESVFYVNDRYSPEFTEFVERLHKIPNGIPLKLSTFLCI